jgi:transcriptional regulator with XRE-family HTH domain
MAPTTQQRPPSCSLPETFGRNLKAFREAENLSLDDFATLLGIDRATVESIERGEQDLSLERIEIISATLGIEPLLLLE